MVSERLLDALMAYCNEMDEPGLEALLGDVRRGGLAWFPQEFADAIRAGDFTPELWERLTNIGIDEDDYRLLGKFLREVWAAVAPAEPFPAGPLISDRLTSALGVYCLEMDRNLVGDLRIAIAEGPLSWFPAEFERAVRSAAFTPATWEKITGVLMDPDDYPLLGEYLREVWAAAAPGRAFPARP